MISGSKAHLRENGETYVEHLRFAATIAMLSIGAGLACLIHALVPALCTTTASRTIRHVTALLGKRDELDHTRAEASELLAFLFLLMLSVAVVVPLWLMPIPVIVRIAYSLLALAIPLTLLMTNRELASRENDARMQLVAVQASH
jgi:hypothetical protein